MAVDFPSPAVDGQLYPDISAGDVPLENGRVYVYDAAAEIWNLQTQPGSSLDDFVLKAGDTMTGALTMDNASMIETVNTAIEMRRTMPDDGSGNWDANRSRFGIIKSRCPSIVEADGTEILEQSGPFGIEINLADRNSYKNTFRVTTKDNEIVRITSGGTPAVSFNDQIDRSSLADNKGIEKGVEIRGISTPDFDLTPGNYAVNKEYVDERNELLRQDIIELEEEIDAIAPTLERGQWLFNPLGHASNPGLYGLLALGTQTNEYAQADTILINSIEADGEIHNFADVEEGHYLEVFSPDDDDYGLYLVKANNGESAGGNSYWSFDIDHLRSNRPIADAEGLCRIKFFKLSEGADVDTFVIKTGDDMTGELNFRTEQPNGNANYSKPSLKEKDLRFSTTRTDTDSTRHAYLYQPGYSENLMSSGHLISGRHFYTTGYYYGYSSTGGSNFTTLNPRLKLTETRGDLLWDSNEVLYWDNSAISVKKPIYIYNQAKAISNSHAIHKGYVDDKIKELLDRIEELEMAGGGGRNYHFPQVEVDRGSYWDGYSHNLYLWGDDFGGSGGPGTSSYKLQIQLPNNNDGSAKWLIKPQGHIVINDLPQSYTSRNVGSIIFYPGEVETKTYTQYNGPQTYYEITGDFAPTDAKVSVSWNSGEKVRMTFVGGSVEEL